LNALPAYGSLLVAPQWFSRTLRFGILNAYTPTPNGLARFSAGLSDAVCGHGPDASVIRVADGQASSNSPVIRELVDGSTQSITACRDSLNQVDVAVIQHADGACGGVVGDEVVDILDGLLVPSIVIAHTIPNDPTSQQRSVLEAIAAMAGQVVVMSEVARKRLCLNYAVDRHKVTMIPHGATIPHTPRAKRPSRPTILTWGLLGPGKGIERVIDAMPSLDDLPGRPRYLVVGPTDPKALAVEGEEYRNARIEQARRMGVADSVSFDPGYYSQLALAALIQQSSVVVLPYDSTEQVTSAVLVDAIANGRPVVATAFPHAVELLNSGAGTVVDHDDPVALATALREVITQPRLAGSMAAEARRRAPEMAWPMVASAYIELAQRLVAEGRSRRQTSA
jgi:glycosyltransferase involved in cell wall biosynthesis